VAMSLGVDLHRLSKSVNLAIPLFAGALFLSGTFVSFYFHFLTVPMIFLATVNYFYLYVQRRHALLRNYGILAQARYVLESVGPELRQYLFASDTEERPFSRVERSEVYRKALNEDSTLSFGSLGQFDATEVKIRHSMFPVPAYEIEKFSVVFGEERGCLRPFTIGQPIMISAMSYGALGAPAVRALARGAGRAHVAMNTGEGGFPKYALMEECELIFQMGTAKFGVRHDDATLDDRKLRELAANPKIRMIEIKFSQGAKPGKGGLLPKDKITPEISELRGVPLGRDVVSPPSHAECVDFPSTVAFIRRVQEVSAIPTGIKLCLGRTSEFRELVAEMIRQDSFPDYISIDGAEGGTGAAPQSFMDQVGMPLLPAIYIVEQTLIELGVRQRTKLLAAGKLINAGRILVAMALGADACYTARGFMLSIGCIQALQCGKNTCPVGITTHNAQLQRGLDIEQKATRVANYVRNLVHDFEQLLAATGVRRARDLTHENLYIPAETALAEAVGARGGFAVRK